MLYTETKYTKTFTLMIYLNIIKPSINLTTTTPPTALPCIALPCILIYFCYTIQSV